MDDLLWAWAQPHGAFLLIHIGWLVVVLWVLSWLLNTDFPISLNRLLFFDDRF